MSGKAKVIRGYSGNHGLRRVARKAHLCQWGDCRRIEPGEVYVSSVCFPNGDDAGYAKAAGHPVRMALCAKCALRYGYDFDIPYDQLCRQGLL